MSDLERRVEALEEELARLKESVGVGGSKTWWEQIAGSYHNQDEYREAMKLGAEYRASLRASDAEE